MDANVTSSDQFDLILWGATGFTGTLVAHYLARRADSQDLRWALAGRNQTKLEEIRRQLGPDFQDLPLLNADCFDRDSLDALVAQTNVICSTVGPYSEYGSELVAACVEGGADYCDLTGEAHWIRKMIDTHHDAAKDRGVRIVHCCGFDSIPSDLGTHLVQQEAKRRFGAFCDEVKFYVWKIRGGVSGGTIASMASTLEAAGEDRDIRRTLGDPYGLNPQGQRSGPDSSFQQGPRRDKTINAWTGPFVMATINEKVVRRTNALLDFRYGPEFRYSESSRVGKGIVGALRAGAMSAGFGAFGAGMMLKPTRKLLERFVLPAPGEGPSKEAVEKGYFTVRLVGLGTSEDGRAFEITATVGADKDPGYGATAIMLGESALCLALDEINDGLSGGILTPASAMGETLIDRLRDAMMTFSVTR